MRITSFCYGFTKILDYDCYEGLYLGHKKKIVVLKIHTKKEVFRAY